MITKNFQVFRLTVLILALTLPFLPSRANGETPPVVTRDDLISGIRNRKDMLHSATVRCNQEIFKLDDHSTKEDIPKRNLLVLGRKYELQRQGEKMRVKRETYYTDDQRISSVDVYAWNGKRKVGYTQFLDRKQRTGGTVKGEKGDSGLYWFTPLELEVFDIPKPLWDLVDELQWSVTGPEQVGEYQAYRLESSGSSDDPRKVRIWVDPTRDFAPVRVSLTLRYEGIKEISEEMTDVKLIQQNGIWIVGRATMSIDNPNNPKNGRTIHHFSVQDCKIGLELPDKTFDVEFPHGTWVWDDILKTGYIAGEGVFVKNDDGKMDLLTTNEEKTDSPANESGQLESLSRPTTSQAFEASTRLSAEHRVAEQAEMHPNSSGNTAVSILLLCLAAFLFSGIAWLCMKRRADDARSR